MPTPLPPALAELERALEATRAPLPEALRARVLAAAAKATPARKRLSTGWFAAAVAVAAAVALNLSRSASFAIEPPTDAPDPCAISRALYEAPESCR